jgi:hypothetical protein
MTKNGTIREDGTLVRDMYLFEGHRQLVESGQPDSVHW